MKLIAVASRKAEHLRDVNQIATGALGSRSFVDYCYWTGAGSR